MPEHLTRDAFADLLNAKFHIHATPEHTIEAELMEVTEVTKTAYNESFSIFFRVPTGIYLPQHLYKMENSSLGSFELFLVPVGKNEQGIKYEALFNRLVE